MVGIGLNGVATLCCYSAIVFSVIDVGSEWRTFSNEKSATDRSRVGQAEVNILQACIAVLLQ